jgi:hypothetical protein
VYRKMNRPKSGSLARTIRSPFASSASATPGSCCRRRRFVADLGDAGGVVLGHAEAARVPREVREFSVIGVRATLVRIAPRNLDLVR